MSGIFQDVGFHGTTWARWEIIEKEHFKSTPGRIGTGAYFWAEPFAKQLAQSWYEYCLDKNYYPSTASMPGAIIQVELTVGEDEYCVLDDPDTLRMLHQLFLDWKLSTNPSDQELAKIHDFLITKLKKQGLDIKLASKKVALPPGASNYYPTKVLGQPVAYLVIDMNCITIIETSKHEPSKKATSI